jgi:hypothetical protein
MIGGPATEKHPLNSWVLHPGSYDRPHSNALAGSCWRHWNVEPVETRFTVRSCKQTVTSSGLATDETHRSLGCDAQEPADRTHVMLPHAPAGATGTCNLSQPASLHVPVRKLSRAAGSRQERPAGLLGVTPRNLRTERTLCCYLHISETQERGTCRNQDLCTFL